MNKSPNPKQLTECLPKGCDRNSLLTVEQFLIWRRRGRAWFTVHREKIPGVMGMTLQDCVIHVGTHIDLSVNKQTE